MMSNTGGGEFQDAASCAVGQLLAPRDLRKQGHDSRGDQVLVAENLTACIWKQIVEPCGLSSLAQERLTFAIIVGLYKPQ